jgi:hypothetical protein
MFCRLMVYRRIATRYDELAINFLAAIYLAAAVINRAGVAPALPVRSFGYNVHKVRHSILFDRSFERQ